MSIAPEITYYLFKLIQLIEFVVELFYLSLKVRNIVCIIFRSFQNWNTIENKFCELLDIDALWSLISPIRSIEIISGFKLI